MVEIGGDTPDPAEHFVVADTDNFASAAEFRARLGQALRARQTRSAIVYVHGFNNTMADGVFRIAQLENDLKFEGVPVHYSWPSRAQAARYIYDRDSALFARQGMVRLLDEVAAAGAQEILIVAHSMGSFLTMETLRQVALTGRDGAWGRIRGVVLIAPDVDVALFRSQMADIGRPPGDMVIFVSARDPALRLSARLTGEPDRLGSIRSLERVADLPVTVIDVTQFDDAASRHFVVGTSPTILRMIENAGSLRAAFDAAAHGRAGLVTGTVLTVQNATEVILSPVEAVTGLR
jgi:esterase/lipase superfamily enzyme